MELCSDNIVPGQFFAIAHAQMDLSSEQNQPKIQYGCLATEKGHY